MTTEWILKTKLFFTQFILIWMVISVFNPVNGFSQILQSENSFKKTTEARLAVEKAWETYHHGALGGTLHSPDAQTQLEINLHKSRALLADAYEAEEKGDVKQLNSLVKNILFLTNQVITQSQVRKQ